MHTSSYDTMIADYLKKERGDDSLPETLTMTFEKVEDMRYGENPHQKAAFYREIGKKKGSLVCTVTEFCLRSWRREVLRYQDVPLPSIVRQWELKMPVAGKSFKAFTAAGSFFPFIKVIGRVLLLSV